MGPPKAWFKLVDPESAWSQVPLTEVENVDDLKKAIKKERENALKDHDAADLTLKATNKVEDVDVNQARELDARQDLASILKDFKAAVPDDVTLMQKSFAENIRLFVFAPVEVAKRKAEELVLASVKRAKKWHVNSTIYPEIRPFCYYAEQKMQNQELIEHILEGQYIRLYGPRASGKSSRVWEAMEQLESQGYQCLYTTLEDANVRNEESYWKSLNDGFGDEACLPVTITDPQSFRKAFSPASKRWNLPVIIFIDEFDKLHDKDSADACSSALSSIRAVRNDRGKTVIHSIISIGTFAILELDQTKQSLSPFNITENFKGTSLTAKQVEDLFKEYSKTENITIDPMVIEDICALTNGHAGLVSLCGRAIHRFLYPETDPKMRVLSFDTWQKFTVTKLQDVITEYPTFSKM
ncbi:6021_t:CDS:2, partial [Paraglomus brasilianum]